MLPSGGRIWPAITLICCHILFFSSVVQAHIQHPSAKHHNAIAKRDPLSDSELTSASWIWTVEPTTGNVAFLRTFSSAAGKTATSATIAMTAVNSFTFWVNGQPIGSSGTGADDWKSAQAFSAGLNATTNTFAVLAVNNADPSAPAPGFVAAIKIIYSDGSGETIVSDRSWAVSATIPTDFPTPADISHFVSANVFSPFGFGPWGSSVTVPSPLSSSGILAANTWIWSTKTAATEAAVGTVGFRKIIATPSGKTVQSATALIAADNGFSLYLNGHYIGASPGVPVVPNYKQAQQFTGLDLGAASNTFTIFASNMAVSGSTVAGPAGLVAAITIQYTDGTSSVVGTDATWLSGAFTSVPTFLATADAALTPTFALGKMGVAPWGLMTGVSNVLAAPKVPSGPFASGTVPKAPASGGNSASASSVSSASQPSASQVSSANPSSPSASTTGPEGGVISPSGTDSVSAPGSSSSSNSAADAASGANNATSSHISTTLIVAIIVGVIALVAVCLGLFCWRRRARDPLRHARSQSMQLFDAANPSLVGGHSQVHQGQAGNHSQFGGSAALSVAHSAGGSSQRTSMTSVGRAELVTVQPQHAPYTYPRPPVMVQGGMYVQPQAGGYPQPVMAQPVYVQASSVAGSSYPQPPQAVYGQAPSSNGSGYSQPSQAVYGQAPSSNGSGYPQPSQAVYGQAPSSNGSGHSQQSRNWVVEGGSSQPASPPPTSAPLSKLEREMLWRNNGAGSSNASSARTSVELEYARDGPSGTQAHTSDAAYGGFSDAEAVAPPSYSVQ